MPSYSFRPRKTFNANLAYPGKLDSSVTDDHRAAIDILLSGDKFPKEYRDHDLKRKDAGYREFHVWDTQEGIKFSEFSNVLVVGYFCFKRKRVLFQAPRRLGIMRSYLSTNLQHRPNPIDSYIITQGFYATIIKHTEKFATSQYNV